MGMYDYGDNSGWASRRLARHNEGSMVVRLELDVPEWMDRALCAQVDHEIFFPEKGGSTRQAKQLCQTCDVLNECLEYALEHQERFGIWGGTSERDRRRISKARAS